MSLSLIVSGAGAIVVAIGLVMLLVRCVRAPRGDLIAWSVALAGLLLSLGAQAAGHLMGFGAVTFRAMELGAGVVAPLALIMGLSEAVARTVPGRFAGRLLIPAFAVTPLVIFAIDPLSSTAFTKAWPDPATYYELVPNWTLEYALAPVTIIVAVITVAMAVRRSRREFAWRAALLPVTAAGLAVLALALPGLAPAVRDHLGYRLPLSSAFAVLCLLAGLLTWYAGTGVASVPGDALRDPSLRARGDRAGGDRARGDRARGDRDRDAYARGPYGDRDGYGYDGYDYDTGPYDDRAPGTPAAPGREGSLPEAVRPDSARLEDARADGALPDSARPGSALPGGALPAGALPAGALPAGALPGSALPGSALPGSARLDGGPSDGAIADGARPDAAGPDGAGRWAAIDQTGDIEAYRDDYDGQFRQDQERSGYAGPRTGDYAAASPLPPAGTETREDLFGQIAIYTLIEDQVDEFDRLTKRVVARVRSSEPSTLVYIVHAVPSAPMQRILYEVYRDRAAYDWHLQQPYVSRFEEDRRPYVLATNVIELGLQHAKVSPFPSITDLFGEPGYDTSGFERPDFTREYGSTTGANRAAGPRGGHHRAGDAGQAGR